MDLHVTRFWNTRLISRFPFNCVKCSWRNVHGVCLIYFQKSCNGRNFWKQVLVLFDLILAVWDRVANHTCIYIVNSEAVSREEYINECRVTSATWEAYKSRCLWNIITFDWRKGTGSGEGGRRSEISGKLVILRNGRDVKWRMMEANMRDRDRDESDWRESLRGKWSGNAR